MQPEADRVLMVGMTRKGKTTLAEWIVAQLQPVRTIIFDPKEDFADGYWGFPAARSPEELAAAMHQPVVHYIPRSFDRDELEEACQIVWVTPGPYVWWVDETSEVTNANYCPEGLRLAATQGAKKQKLLLALTQRLAESHPVFRSQAEHVILFVPSPIELDRKAIAGAIRREHHVIDRELTELHAEHGDYSHLWYVRDGDELRRMKPIPLEPAAGRQPPPADREPATQPNDQRAESTLDSSTDPPDEEWT